MCTYLVKISVHNKISRLLAYLFLLFSGGLFAQESPKVKGLISDSLTGEPLPYASVNFINGLEGGMANEKGYYEINQIELENDTLLFSFLGYDSKRVPFNRGDSSFNVKLKAHPIEISTVNVHPKPAIYYLKLALSKSPMNIPDQDYNSVSYFKQKFYENKKLLNQKEMVLKNYYPDAVLDSTKSMEENQDSSQVGNDIQTQLLLLRDNGIANELSFGSKKLAKERKKAAKKGKEEPEDPSSYLIDSLFGGPKTMIRLARANNASVAITDTSLMEYKDFDVKFNPKTNEKMMVIDVISESTYKKVPKIQQTYYIDIRTDAIMAYESAFFINVPTIAKPILFVMGIGVDYVKANISIYKNEILSKWYTDKVFMNIELDITKKYMFKENENSLFVFDQFYKVSNFNIESPSPIKEDYRFDNTVDYKKQIHNDIGISWSDVNTVK